MTSRYSLPELPEPLTLRLTCSACPEQYDVVLDGAVIGYLRLRHSSFTAYYPDAFGELVFEEQYAPHSHDDWGVFEPEDRHRHLIAAVEAIARHHIGTLMAAAT